MVPIVDRLLTNRDISGSLSIEGSVLGKRIEDFGDENGTGTATIVVQIKMRVVQSDWKVHESRN